MRMAILGLLLLSLLTLCSWTLFGRPPLTAAEKVFLSAAQGIEKKYSLQIRAEGGGSTDGKKRVVDYGFEKVSPCTTIEEARRLIVPVAEEFLAAINAHAEIANALVQFPFTWDNVSIDIVFVRPDRQSVFSPYVWFVSIQSGTLYYGTRFDTPAIPDHPSYKKTTQEETLAEAKRILAAEAAAEAAPQPPCSTTLLQLIPKAGEAP